MSQVLIVDDEVAMRAALEHSFRRRGWRVQTAAGVREAVAKFRNAPARLVVTDMCMEDGNGLEVMQEVRSCIPGTPVVFLTAYGSVPGAVQAIKEGACDYLQKPVAFEELVAVAQKLLPPASDAEGEADCCDGIGRSPAFLSVMARARRAALTDADVLIEAESGTGKELLARLIHKASNRSEGAFVAVNCSAFPDNLLESELFGHVRGAFTGAHTAKPGKFELASGGTLLLDEIGEMPLTLQPKLLRVLQEREIDRLGDTRPVPVDVRVIATTNRSLRAQMEAGTFRPDLFYRLNVVPLTLPSLRERRDDILPLAEHFLRKHEPKDRPGMHRISPELAAQLEAHDWPGNIRELENFIRRALALATGPSLRAEPFEIDSLTPRNEPAAGLHPGVTLQEAERQLLEKTLLATGGNRTKAAELMGVSLRTVRNKIREYGLPARRPS
ncbi:MAG TPA: sigma-54 dependent transcriptional regulator [Terriglobales bacterium]|nr:sigma-54 dependent transcriptional regulator [Terriglobales bacterium]